MAWKLVTIVNKMTDTRKKLYQNRLQYIWQKIHHDIRVEDDFFYMAGDYHNSPELHLWLSSSANTLYSMVEMCGGKIGSSCKVNASHSLECFCAIQRLTVSKGKFVPLHGEVVCHSPEQMISELREWIREEQAQKQQKRKRSWILKRIRHSTSDDLMTSPRNMEEDDFGNRDHVRFQLPRSQSLDSPFRMLTPRKKTP